MLRLKQSSWSVQHGPCAVALKGAVAHGSGIASGERQRRSPVGGAAYGIPSQATTPAESFEHVSLPSANETAVRVRLGKYEVLTNTWAMTGCFARA